MRIVEPATNLIPSLVARVRHECGALIEIRQDEARGKHVTCPACEMPPWMPVAMMVFVDPRKADAVTPTLIDDDTVPVPSGMREKRVWLTARFDAAIAEAEALEAEPVRTR